jgi:carbon storage regulator
MLVLTRKRNEMIRVGDNVVIKVIKTGKGSVKIGIEAPANIRVLRGELEPFEETEVAEESVEEDEHRHGAELAYLPHAV